MNKRSPETLLDNLVKISTIQEVTIHPSEKTMQIHAAIAINNNRFTINTTTPNSEDPPHITRRQIIEQLIYKTGAAFTPYAQWARTTIEENKAQIYNEQLDLARGLAAHLAYGLEDLHLLYCHLTEATPDPKLDLREVATDAICLYEAMLDHQNSKWGKFAEEFREAHGSPALRQLCYMLAYELNVAMSEHTYEFDASIGLAWDFEVIPKLADRMAEKLRQGEYEREAVRYALEIAHKN